MGTVVAGLPLAVRLLLVARYRTNLTMPRLTPLFGISPTTVCRVIQGRAEVLACSGSSTSTKIDVSSSCVPAGPGNG
ncbi:transposase family protein [Streptomyces pseudovenezuelae]|uniref:Transposase Helix-turn-helix domain-containing protein n=1 Tax=Streptomyces pseudovenezuelae TaxID=67350 RepID=A0ABT6M459_9ACTN|nr:hypothetical protein [Streptomyces pseudovenezuelae]